jgi:hypothetical protein
MAEGVRWREDVEAMPKDGRAVLAWLWGCQAAAMVR